MMVENGCQLKVGDADGAGGVAVGDKLADDGRWKGGAPENGGSVWAGEPDAALMPMPEASQAPVGEEQLWCGTSSGIRVGRA